jgi:curved DNA-binding protein CbpA
MSLLHDAGDLAQTPLAAILLEALNLRATGAFTIQAEQGSFKLFIHAGVPVGAQVYAGFKPLGQFLLAKGIIDIQMLDQSLSEMARTHKQQGEVLVEMGAVDRATMDRLLSEQQAEYISRIASLEKGSVQFDPDAAIPAWTGGIRVSPLRAILDALEKPQAGMLVAGALQQIVDTYVAIPGNTSTVAEVFGLDGNETSFAGRLQRPNRIEELLEDAPVSPERARAMLAAFLLLGLAEPSAGGFLTPPPRPSIVLDLAQLGGETLLGPANLDWGTPSGAEPPAPVDVPEVTPDLAPPTALTDGPAEPARRSDPAQARSRRQRLLARAMQNMGIGPLANRPAEPRAPPPAGRPTPPPEPGKPGSPSPMDPADAALRRALELAATRIGEPDLFARLGVPRTAGRDEVKQAYLLLAKQFHPDRFISPGLAEVAPVVKDLFSALNEAYETLGDDRRRNEYLARLSSGTASVGDSGVGALLDFKKGESYLKSRDYPRARGFLEAAIRADPRAEYKAALAWALIRDPKSPDRERAKTLLDEALQDQTCDRASYIAGVLAREQGDDQRAEALFRGTLRANPQNVDAAREIRLLEMRRQKKGGGQRPG